MTGIQAAPVRRRSSRRTVICEAVFDLLGEFGYDQTSMDAVAARAHVSKATIYRSWHTKPDLVIDALTHRFGSTPPVPDTGTLRGDLLMVAGVGCQLAGSADGAVVAGLMSAAAHNPELSGALHRCTYQMKHALFETIIARAVARGEAPVGASADTLHEVFHAMVLTRMVLAAAPLDETFVVHVVDDVLLPVLRKEPVVDP